MDSTHIILNYCCTLDTNHSSSFGASIMAKKQDCYCKDENGQRLSEYDIFLCNAKNQFYADSTALLEHAIYCFVKSRKSPGLVSYEVCGNDIADWVNTDDDSFTIRDAYLSCYFVYELFKHLQIVLPKTDDQKASNLECERSLLAIDKNTFLVAVASIPWLRAFFDKIVRLLKREDKFYELNADLSCKVSRADFIDFFSQMCRSISNGLGVYDYQYDPSFSVIGDNGISNFIEKINELYKKITGCQKSLGTIVPGNTNGQ